MESINSSSGQEEEETDDTKEPDKESRCKITGLEANSSNETSLNILEDFPTHSNLESTSLTVENNWQSLSLTEEIGGKNNSKNLLYTVGNNCQNLTENTNENNVTKIFNVNSRMSKFFNVNSRMSKFFNVNSRMSKFFVVNESVFLDTEPTMMSGDELHQYKLYKVMRKPADGQNDELTDEDLTETLLVTEEPTKSGLIINNNVYLTNEQWNTIRRINEHVYSCALCNIQCDGASVGTHLESFGHVRNLNGHRPLKRFDLSIIRKINENFHCGVCNFIFPVNDYQEHENSKAHEGNLLFAINKVCDLMYSGENTTTQMLNTNNIQAPNNSPAGYNLDINLPYMHSESGGNAYSTGSNQVRHSEPNKNAELNNTSSSSLYRNDALDRTVGNTESASNTEPYRNTESTYTENGTLENLFGYGGIQNLHNFNFEKTFNIQKIYEEDDIEEYTLPIEGVSYASMASKPRVDVPKFFKIDLGNKEVRVKFESWNMITQTDLNHYYCMVCTVMFHVRFKYQHCMDGKHKRVLATCAVVGAFEDYLIRDVCDKLYHCGHCNNLQCKNDMQIHVDKFHPIKNPNNPKPSKLPLQDTVINKTIKTPKLDIFGEFKFTPFGAQITITNLSCHTLILVGDAYLCALCNVKIQGDLLEHVYNATHVQWINMTPFIRPFRCNLTRAVRGSLHCAICNILVPVNGITDHNIDPAHTSALARALGMVKNEKPRQEIKYQVEEPAEFKNELNRFLSTLSPNTRGALSNFQIKNHKGESFQLSDATSSSSSNGTPNISLNTSPVHIKADNKTEPVASTTQEQNNYPHKGAELKYDTNLLSSFFPGKGVDTIKPGSEASYPRKRAETNPVGYSAGVNPTPAAFYSTPANINSFYPTKGVHRNMIYPSGLPLLKTGQLLTLSMIESGLPGVSTGAPNVPIQVQNTGPTSAMNSGVRVPVAPISRQNEPVELNPGIKRDLKVPEKEVKEENVEMEKVHEKATADTNKPDVRKNSLTDGSDDEELPFILDEIVLLKSKSSYFKVSSTSYHTLVHHGSGTRHCFVCSSRLEYSSLRSHVASRKHQDNIARNRFLYNFCGPLFRQMYLTYHCAVCNVTMSRKEVKMHLEWPTHIDRYDISCKKINKKVLERRKEFLKSGAKEFCVETQKEFLYEKKPEPPINIVTYVQSSRDEFQEAYVEEVERKYEEKNQMVILNGNMMKISFSCWHGILHTKSGAKCILCQQELPEGIQTHLGSQYHAVALGITFEKQYYPALIRKINENTTNCVICNLELPNDDSLVFEHISGRKHEKNYHTILEKTSHTDSYSDCYKYPITL